MRGENAGGRAGRDAAPAGREKGLAGIAVCGGGRWRGGQLGQVHRLPRNRCLTPAGCWPSPPRNFFLLPLACPATPARCQWGCCVQIGLALRLRRCFSCSIRVCGIRDDSPCVGLVAINDRLIAVSLDGSVSMGAATNEKILAGDDQQSWTCGSAISPGGLSALPRFGRPHHD